WFDPYASWWVVLDCPSFCNCVCYTLNESQVHDCGNNRRLTPTARPSVSRDARLGRMTHVIVHMALLGGRETSERIAQMLGTNPVVVRRTMAGLKRCGIVSSEGGRGGGWVLL